MNLQDILGQAKNIDMTLEAKLEFMNTVSSCEHTILRLSPDISMLKIETPDGTKVLPPAPNSFISERLDDLMHDAVHHFVQVALPSATEALPTIKKKMKKELQMIASHLTDLPFPLPFDIDINDIDSVIENNVTAEKVALIGVMETLSEKHLKNCQEKNITVFEKKSDNDCDHDCEHCEHSDHSHLFSVSLN